MQAEVLRRGEFAAKKGLEKVFAYVERFNDEGRLFQWIKPTDEILRSLTKLTKH